MTVFVVIRERGPAWDWARDMREQDGWDEHAKFMDALAEEGFIVAGGPLEDGRALHVVRAESEEAVRARFAPDPWEPSLLGTASVSEWKILLGGLSG